MPQNLRDGLLDRLTACFEPDTIKTLDTATYKGEHVFQVLHFTWYNRHCTMVSASTLSVKGTHKYVLIPRDMTHRWMSLP